MAASTTALNQGLDGLTGTVSGTNVMAFASLHTAAPSSAGSNEYAGVTRQSCSWNAASGGAKTNSSSLSFTTSGSTAVTDVGTFSASTSGTFGIALHLSSTVTATTITVAAGALSIGGTAT